ncbi:MAG: NAD-binding protein [Haloarculaceae archaeon]
MGRWARYRIRAALLLAGTAAVLSVVTGLVNISDPTVTGPLAAYVPAAVQRVAGFTGALTGFLLLASAFGLRRRYRAAWYATLVMLPVAALQGLAQSSPYSYPLVAVSVLAFPVVSLTRDVFDRDLALTTSQLAALGALVGALGYSTVGAYALRAEFGGLDTLLDAFYFAVVTASTVGYGDITPQSAIGRLFGVSALVLGTAAFAVALGTLLGPAIEARFARALGTMTDSALELLENHVVVVGYGDLTEPILEELDVPFVVVTIDAEKAQRLRDRGYEVVVDDPSDEEPLRRVGIDRARALVAATQDDARDALAILTARELNPDLRIVAAATERENETKLRRAGADVVISPAVIGGHMLVESALRETDAEGLADRILEASDESDLD